MNIRKYTENDFPRISSIYSACKQEEFSGENSIFDFQCLENDTRNYPEFMESEKYVCESHSILGFITLFENTIGWLYVDPRHRNLGVGSRLIEYLLHASNRALYLKVIASNMKAIGFYGNHGFQMLREFETNIQERKVKVVEMKLKMANQRIEIDGQPATRLSASHS